MPNLEGPGMPGAIGQEMAILNFIGRKVPAMAGKTDADFCTSQQLMCISEDVFSKLSGFGAPTINAAKNEDWQVAKRKSAMDNYVTLHTFIPPKTGGQMPTLPI